MKFTNSFTTKNIEIDGRPYTLTEGDGHVVGKYTDARAQSLKFGSGGKIAGVRGVSGLDTLIVHLCLTYSEPFEDGQKKHSKNIVGNRVPQDVVGKWKGRIVQQLAELAKEMTGIDADSDSKEKRLLKHALEQPQAPCTFEELKAYLIGLGDDYRAAQLLVATTEELAKNEQSETTDGSE